MTEPQRPEPDELTGKAKARSVGRRHDDVVRAESVHAGRLRVLNLALGAMSLLALIAAVSAVLLWLETGKDQTALSNANAAVTQADMATQRADAALAAIQDAQARQAIQLQQGCERLNVQRANVNATSEGLYLLFRVILDAPATPQRGETRAQRRTGEDFERTLHGAVRVLAWTPLTDCIQAVKLNGSAYRAPGTIRFTAQLPPRSAILVRNARRPQPVGSVP